MEQNGFPLNLGKEYLSVVESISNPGEDDKDIKSSRSQYALSLHEFKDRLAVCFLSPHDLFQVAASLIQQVFVEPHVSFFSFTETQEEITVVLPENMLRSLPQLRPCVESWHVFTAITPDTGINEVGILERATKPFKDDSISIFVLSTYRAVNVLVEISAHEKAVAAIQRSKTLKLKAH